MQNDKTDYVKLGSYAPTLNHDEIQYFYFSFLNSLEDKLIAKYNLFKINLPLVNLAKDIQDYSINRKLYFDELNSSNVYELNNNLLKHFINYSSKVEEVVATNTYSVINSFIHDRDIIHKSINQNFLILGINDFELQIDEKQFYVELSKLINEILKSVEKKLALTLDKDIVLNSLLPTNLNAYKALKSAKKIVPIFKGFDASFFSSVKANKFVLLDKAFFNDLNLNKGEIFYLFDKNELVDRYDYYGYQKNANVICHFFSFFKTSKKEKKPHFYCLINIIDLVLYFLQNNSIKEIVIAEQDEEMKKDFSDFNIKTK